MDTILGIPCAHTAKAVTAVVQRFQYLGNLSGGFLLFKGCNHTLPLAVCIAAQPQHKFASLYEDDFLKAVIGHSQQADEADRKLKEKELKALLARDEELDGLFERIYEDNVSGKISDERFSRMSRRYEDEQKELTEKIKQFRSEIEKQSNRTMTTDMFISLVRKYTRAKKLTPRMLNELVEKIEVFNAEKVNGVWEQRLRIHYNCVGTIEIPSTLPLPTPDVSVNTRKGVVVNYAPCDVAI